MVRGRPDLDQRQWAWYQRARQAGRSVWVDTYLFLNDKGEATYPGVTYASPLYRDGKLRVDGLVTHRMPFAEINAALDKIRAGEVGRCILEMAS